MDRKECNSIWLEIPGSYKVRRFALGSALHEFEVHVPMAIHSARDEAATVERVRVEVLDSGDFYADVELADAQGLAQQRTLPERDAIQLGEVSAKVTLHRKGVAHDGAHRGPFGLYAWTEWSSSEKSFRSKRVLLEMYEPLEEAADVQEHSGQ